MENYQAVQAPARQLPTSRGVIKAFLLTMITFGIYGIVLYGKLADELNLVASKYDGKKTMHYCLLAFIVAPITFGIAGIVWSHKISNRIGAELNRRGIAYSFSATDFWLWNVLGSLIVVGPFVYLHKMFKAVNMMNAHYNVNG